MNTEREAPPRAQALEKQLDDPSGNRLDAYEVESTHERSDVLQDLAEFQLAAVRVQSVAGGCMRERGLSHADADPNH